MLFQRESLLTLHVIVSLYLWTTNSLCNGNQSWVSQLRIFFLLVQIFFQMSSLDFLLSARMSVCQLRVETTCMMKMGRSFLPVSPEHGSLPPSWPVTCWSPTSCWSTYSLLCSSQCHSTSQLRLRFYSREVWITKEITQEVTWGKTDGQNHRINKASSSSPPQQHVLWGEVHLQPGVEVPTLSAHHDLPRPSHPASPPHRLPPHLHCP